MITLTPRQRDVLVQARLHGVVCKYKHLKPRYPQVSRALIERLVTKKMLWPGDYLGQFVLTEEGDKRAVRIINRRRKKEES